MGIVWIVGEHQSANRGLMTFEDIRPPVRIAEINHHVLELIEVVEQLRECQNKIKSMRPQMPSEVHLLREEVNRLESTLIILNRMGVTQMVTWEQLDVQN